MGSLNLALHSIITRKCSVCCLCFKIIEDNPVNIQDEVVLKDNNNEKTIKIFDILIFVLGYEVCTHSVVFFLSNYSCSIYLT